MTDFVDQFNRGEKPKDFVPDQRNTSVSWDNINNKDGFYITHSLVGAEPAMAANYGVFFIVDYACEVSSVSAIWTTASTSGTLNIERLSGTESLDGGDNILVANIDMSGTADTVNRKSGRDLQNTVLKIGDRLALVDGGTLTNQVDLCVTIYLRRIGKGHYN